MSNKNLPVEFFKEMAQIFNANQLPKGGMALIKDQGAKGTWSAVLPSTAAAKQFRDKVGGDMQPSWKGMPVVKFNAGGNHTVDVLKTYLERCGYNPELRNNPI